MIDTNEQIISSLGKIVKNQAPKIIQRKSPRLRVLVGRNERQLSAVAKGQVVVETQRGKPHFILASSGWIIFMIQYHFFLVNN